MNSKIRYLIRNLVLFLISGGIPQLLSMLMIPLYTSYLSESDYGIADLLTNTVQLLMPFFTLQVQDAVLRYSMDSTVEKRDVLSIGVHITLRGGVVLTILAIIIGKSNWVGINNIYLIFLIINYLLGSLNNIFSYFCRGIDQVKVVALGSTLSTLIMIFCNIVFLTCFKWGLNGYLIANSLGTLVGVLVQYIGARLYGYLRLFDVSKELKKDMIKISIPMIFSALAWWVNNASDKYVLTWFIDTSIVGIYAIAYKLPTLFSALSNVVAKAFSISAIKEFDNLDSDGFLGRTYSIISFIMVLCCAGTILMNIPLAKCLYSKGFFTAWKYVPPLLVAILFNQLSLLCENIFLAMKRTSITCKTAVIGAVCNVIFNIILIPRSGAYGAAIATMLGFGIVWLLRYINLRKVVVLKNNLIKEGSSYLLLIIQMILSYFGNELLVGQIIIIGVILAIYRKEITHFALSLMKRGM